MLANLAIGLLIIVFIQEVGAHESIKAVTQGQYVYFEPVEHVYVELPTQTPTPQPTPTPIPETPQDKFRSGYKDRAQGDPYLLGFLEHVVVNVIGSCECSSWNCGAGLHLGVAQFSYDTWAKSRRAPDSDPLDYYEQGWAVADWILEIKGNEGTSSGWPRCWWVNT